MNFESKLALWYNENKRALPWRATSNPYLIWLSEVIMQQTRIAQGLDYYTKFSERFPTILDLAKADMDEVMKMWEGLGYYSRARNLHAAAQQIAYVFKGRMPETYSKLLQIKGIGPYTAAAISSICFDEKQAVVDGNVYRVLSRVFGIETPINSSLGKTEFTKLANEIILKTKSPGEHNQAMMEFGALHCKPKSPKCEHCIFSAECVAHSTGKVTELPVKQKAKPLRKRYFNYLVVFENKKVAIQKRTEKDIWSGLYQFPLIESAAYQKQHVTEGLVEKPIKHILSHQELHIAFFSAKKNDLKAFKDLKWVAINEIKKLGFPIVLARFIDSNLLPLHHHLD